MTVIDTHIVAMGGGGFSMEPDNPALDQLRARSRAPRESVGVFSGDGIGRCGVVYRARSTPPSRSSPAGRARAAVRAHAGSEARPARAGCDLRRRRQHQEHARGVAGMGDAGAATSARGSPGPFWPASAPERSAGSRPGSPIRREPASIRSHVWVFSPGACCPHYDGEAERRPALRRLVEQGSDHERARARRRRRRALRQRHAGQHRQLSTSRTRI